MAKANKKIKIKAKVNVNKGQQNKTIKKIEIINQKNDALINQTTIEVNELNQSLDKPQVKENKNFWKKIVFKFKDNLEDLNIWWSALDLKQKIIRIIIIIGILAVIVGVITFFSITTS